MEKEKRNKLIKSFLYGFIISAVIVAIFVVPANMFGLHFVMGFPLLLIESEASTSDTIIHISWLLPFVVGIVFALVEGISML